MFKDGGTNVHDEERSGRPFVVSDDLFQSVDQKICESRRFIISELSCEFPQILRKVGAENAHGCAQNAENGFDFDVFRAIPQRWR
jgi:hypothetical protein